MRPVLPSGRPAFDFVLVSRYCALSHGIWLFQKLAMKKESHDMSDEDLRELERRWRASGTVDDEAAYLAERLRAGELSAEQVETLAELGYPAGMIVLGKDQEWLAQQRLSETLFDLGPQSLSRAILIILGRLCLEADLIQPPAIVARLIEAVRAWLASPTREHAALAGHEAHLCSAEAVQLDPFGQVVSYTPGILGRVYDLAGILGNNIEVGDDGVGVYAFLIQSRDEYPCLQDQPIRALLCEKLVPWFLGYSDPLNIQVVA